MAPNDPAPRMDVALDFEPVYPAFVDIKSQMTSRLIKSRGNPDQTVTGVYIPLFDLPRRVQDRLPVQYHSRFDIY